MTKSEEEEESRANLVWHTSQLTMYSPVSVSGSTNSSRVFLKSVLMDVSSRIESGNARKGSSLIAVTVQQTDGDERGPGMSEKAISKN